MHVRARSVDAGTLAATRTDRLGSRGDGAARQTPRNRARAPPPRRHLRARRIKASGCGFLAIVARGDELLVWARCRRRGQARREGGDVGNRGAGSTYAWIALVLGRRDASSIASELPC
jgi:hypothetical protein